MIVSYIRSSSYNNWDFCQQQYFLNYVLGIPRKAGKKADQGTIVHKVLEGLALIKKLCQETDSETVILKDEVFGKVVVDQADLMKPSVLDNLTVEKINKSRVNKYKYKHDCKLEYGCTRYGVDIVEELISKAYLHYSQEDWAPVDRKDCANWVWMALESHDGEFDPRKRVIVDAEPHFDIVIDKPWAQYKWDTPHGVIEGNLGIKGTIDLITDIGNGIIEIVDWKTGQRLNWATGKTKEYKDLQKDFQLLLYYYAAQTLYPDTEQIVITIVFVRDGGPFSLCFDSSDVERTEALLQNRFEEIKDCLFPTMVDPTQKDFRCSKICDYYKMKSPDGRTNFCRFIHDKLYQIGIDKVVEQYSNPDFHVDTYNAPGE